MDRAYFIRRNFAAFRPVSNSQSSCYCIGSNVSWCTSNRISSLFLTANIVALIEICDTKLMHGTQQVDRLERSGTNQELSEVTCSLTEVTKAGRTL